MPDQKTRVALRAFVLLALFLLVYNGVIPPSYIAEHSESLVELLLLLWGIAATKRLVVADRD
jgi:hypothetical protein